MRFYWVLIGFNEFKIDFALFYGFQLILDGFYWFYIMGLNGFWSDFTGFI